MSCAQSSSAPYWHKAQLFLTCVRRVLCGQMFVGVFVSYTTLHTSWMEIVQCVWRSVNVWRSMLDLWTNDRRRDRVDTLAGRNLCGAVHCSGRVSHELCVSWMWRVCAKANPFCMSTDMLYRSTPRTPPSSVLTASWRSSHQRHWAAQRAHLFNYMKPLLDWMMLSD